MKKKPSGTIKPATFGNRQIGAPVTTKIQII